MNDTAIVKFTGNHTHFFIHLRPYFLMLMLATQVGSQSAWGYNLESHPTNSDISALASEGFENARNHLESELARYYKPGDQKKANPASSQTFVEWLDLWRWCELLSRETSTENAALVQRHFCRRPNNVGLTIVPPGLTFPPDAIPIPLEEAAQMASAPEVRRELQENVLPSGSTLEGGLLSEVVGKSLAIEVMGDPEFLRAFFSACDDRDFFPLVLKNLRAIREAYPTKWREYANLALAIAFVNDSAVPGFWPHHQVPPSLVPKEIASPKVQFGRWVEANESRKLLLDLRRFSPTELKFVVDAFITPAEMAWAQKKIRLRPGNFDQAFSMIRYRDERITAKKYVWEYGPYTFAAIEKSGGICIDQAYHAALCGKSLGLPTIMFSGQGSNGGHAWFGYMSSTSKWELNCGRDSSQNLVTGTALDPQTWQPVTDHDIQQLAARFRERPEFLASMSALAMSEIFEHAGRLDDARLALQNATRVCPENPVAWSRFGDFLERVKVPINERIQLHEQAIKALSRNPDSKVHHQQALASLQRETGKSLDAAKTENQILTQNLNSRTDLSCEVAATRVKAALEDGGENKGAMEFHKQLQSIGKAGGGNFVNQVGVPFVNALIEKGSRARALRTVDIMRQKFQPLDSSPLDLQLRAMAKSCK